MNVGEKINQLIGTYKQKRKLMPAGGMKVYAGVISVETVIADLEQLKELSTIEYSRKVKIPKFVADWIIHVRSLNWNIQDLLNPSSSKYRTANLVYEWLRENEENTSTLCRAWLDNDYDVEEDPKYWVKLNDGYLSFVTFSYKAASEIETSADCREAILFTFKPQADHMALLVNGIAEEVNHGEKS